MSETQHQFFASCPPGLEALLMDELGQFGAQNLKEHPTHITFEGDISVGYKACLHSRLANRVYLCLLHDRIESAEELYEKVNRIEWGWHFDLKQSFVVDCVARKSVSIKHSGFGALKAKDAIVDYYQERYEQRPSVDKDNPDYRVHVLVNGTQLKVGLDLAGRSLHQRGYRDSKGAAPIKENLAAAMLIRANWPELAKQGYSFHDPMCGTGTILIEAAMIVAEIAPGLLNPRFAFENWKQHKVELWQEMLAVAQRQATKNKLNIVNQIVGTDRHRKSLEMARSYAENAGLAEVISFKEQDIRAAANLELSDRGLIVTNPPYGERLGDEKTILELYKNLGSYFKKQYDGWQAAMITTENAYAKAMGIRSHKQYKLKNGALDCQLYLFDIKPENAYQPFDPNKLNPNWENNLSDGAHMLKNRLRKNMQRLKSYLKQNYVTCYRLYDADLPEYSAAIDVYEDEVVVQEYAAPKDIPEKVTLKRLNEIQRVTSGVLQVVEAKIHIKQRQKQKGTQQYEKHSDSDEFKLVNEQGLNFYVNLNRYLDTGLFLDHRKTRKMIMAEAKGKRFLNLFAYTGSVSAYAALGGAKTTTVDMSKTYINWAMKNFAANKINVYGHSFVQADCLQWLADADESNQFDLIFLDPPTFSNSKRMSQTFDVQRDQVSLIRQAMRLLDTNGKLYFSNNFKKFELEKSLVSEFEVKEISNKTLPVDFQKSRNRHRCWLIEHKP
ncbi:MAG: bifunctional 23S rRNA (guanine(2069)-N(7))-methyltransferase RlmK/23S rRNA (guanine(2445)-N(2))-methyltransferase RlmL [Gammaproteobacteria bacterium]|nr:bifunctional 23S rRNA (guanine(2069)-N(7))-methyltransferase RlmK/23S rRNA (guanine(2445)-N(2))-methyltransferase RlmL [Gammaproteobacteria bacterium]